MKASGNMFLISFAACNSCLEFINENKKHTARESTPSAFNFFKFSLRFFIFKGV